jgi:hypothetical protein
MSSRIAACVLCLGMTAGVAAQDRQLAPEAAGGALENATSEPRPRGAFGTYGERLHLGLEQLYGKDPDGALATLVEAEKLAPAAPLVHCYRGEALLLKQSWEKATTSFGMCRTLARKAGENHALEVALVGLARALDLSGASPERVRQAYGRVVKESTSTAAKMLGAAKVKAIMAAAERREDAARVRARSEARELRHETSHRGARPSRSGSALAASSHAPTP